ncbi:MAG: hypothetical protein JSW27_01045 [Phycisphaerales bacterium]|nr:MAG: hypothetical protein JSW27_01045 [Phycisphaerales bacterium]
MQHDAKRIDANRSSKHRQLLSEFSRDLPAVEKQRLIEELKMNRARFSDDRSLDRTRKREDASCWQAACAWRGILTVCLGMSLTRAGADWRQGQVILSPSVSRPK